MGSEVWPWLTAGHSLSWQAELTNATPRLHHTSPQVLLLHLKRPNSSSSSPDGSGLLATLLRAWLAPRCAVLQQSLRQDARGVHCLLFHSLPNEQARQLMQQAAGGQQQEPALQVQQPLQSQQQQEHHSASQSSSSSSKHRLQNGNGSSSNGIHNSNGAHTHRQPQPPHPQQSVIKAALCSCLRLVSACFLSCVALIAWLLGCDLVHNRSSSSRWPGCWWPPVLLHVCGGFTISGLEGIDGEGSPTQTLVTGIVKVRAWLHALLLCALWASVRRVQCPVVVAVPQHRS